MLSKCREDCLRIRVCECDHGAAVPSANGAPVVLTAFKSQDEFFTANHRLADPGDIAVPQAPAIRPAVAAPATGLDQLAS